VELVRRSGKRTTAAVLTQEDTCILRPDLSPETWGRARTGTPYVDYHAYNLRDTSRMSGINYPICMVSGGRLANLRGHRGPHGHELRFDGIDDFVEVPFDPGQAFLTDPMTLAMWVYADDARDACLVAACAHGPSGRAYGFRLEVTAAGTLRWVVSVAGRFPAPLLVPFPARRWVFVCAGVRHRTLRLDAGGKRASARLPAGRLTPSDHPLYIGADHGVTGFFRGRLAAVAVYRGNFRSEVLK